MAFQSLSRGSLRVVLTSKDLTKDEEKYIPRSRIAFPGSRIPAGTIDQAVRTRGDLYVFGDA